MTTPPAAMDPLTLAKLGKLLPLLGSSHDGEVVAAARSIVRVLEANGASIHDLVQRLTTTEKPFRIDYPWPPKSSDAARAAARPAPKPAPKAKARPKPNLEDGVSAAEVRSFADAVLRDPALSDRDRAFVEQLHVVAKRQKFRFEPTSKQQDWWRDILSRHGLDQSVAEWAAA